jgi:hypothetical protein
MSPIVGNTSSIGKKPGTPVIGNATSSTSTTAEVSFTEPSYKGKSGSVTYTVVSSPDSITATGTSPVTLTGLVTGTGYTFFVYATTNYGVSSDNSSFSNSVTPQVMDANYLIGVENGFTYYSTNLTNWTQTSGINGFSSAFYINSTFYVSDYLGNGSYSTNGISWTTNSNDAFNSTMISYANGIFVSRGLGNNIYTSTDFITWSTRVSPISYNNIDRPPFYLNGKWYTNSNQSASSLLEFSTDSVTWSSTTINQPRLPENGYWQVKFFNSHFYALTNSMSPTPGLLCRSTDGNLWSTITLPKQVSPSEYTLGSGNGRIFIPEYESILSSTNGTTWTSATLPAEGYTPDLAEIIYGTNGKWVSLSSNYATFPPVTRVVESTNGTSFSSGTIVSDNFPYITDNFQNPLSFQMWNIVYGNKYLVSAQATDYTANPFISYNIFKTSTDAVTWSSWTPAVQKNGWAYSRVFFANGVFAAAAMEFNQPPDDINNVVYSTTGLAGSWIKTIGPNYSGGIQESVNNIFIWAGDSSNIIHTSTNATSWTQRTLPFVSNWRKWSFGNSRYLSVDHNNGLTVTFSTNLTSWTTTTYSGDRLPVSGSFLAKSSGARAVIVPFYSSNSTAYTSTDATTWTASNLSIGGGFSRTALAYGNNVFVCAVDGSGTGPGIFVSSNGSTWTQYSYPNGTNSPDNIDFSGSLFYATGSNYGSTVYTSTNGISWTANATNLPDFQGTSISATRVIGKI